MNFNKLFQLATTKGVSEIEAYLHNSEGFSCSLFEGEIDSYKVSSSITLAIRGIYNGKMGNASSENVSEDNFEFIIDRLIDNAKIMGNSLKEEIFKGSEKYFDVTVEQDDFSSYSIETKINNLREIEKLALHYDPRITKVDHLSYDERKVKVEIANSTGLNLTRHLQYGMITLSVVANENDSTKNVYDYVLAPTYAKLGTAKLIQKVCDDALSGLNPQKIETKQYKVILTNKIAGSLLSTFAKVFSADSQLKGITMLKDKLNTQIANVHVNIIDNPLYQDSVAKTSFDDEGVACKEKKVVENGVFKLFLNNLKTASKLKVEPTGNGFKNGPTTSVDVSSLNFYIEPGIVEFDDLIKTTSEGVLIKDVQGLHSGVNTISGDFSIQASGAYIKDGVVKHAVTLLVLSGNFYKMLQDIEEIGNDLKFNENQIGAPSLKIKSMSISS